MKKLIQQISNLNTSEEYKFTQGFSGVDIAKPIILDEVTFRKRHISSGCSFDGNLPFKVTHHTAGIDFYAYKQGYTQLGILLFELLLSDLSFLQFDVTLENSTISTLYFYLNRRDRQYFYNLKLSQPERYAHYTYYFEKIDELFENSGYEPKDSPCFNYGWSNFHDSMGHDRNDKADQLIVSLNITSLIHLAEMFLSIGNISNKKTEICRENPIYGFGGLHNKSIDARFWLPNSFGFYTDDIRDLRFE